MQQGFGGAKDLKILNQVQGNLPFAVSIHDEEPVKEISDDFDFNQDNLLGDSEEYRSPGWARLKKKLLR